jgi:phosphoribosyl-AMP cyclohydrolase
MFDDLHFNEAGLVPVIAQDVATKTVLMLAWANLAALENTMATGLATYYSRSRGEQWVKGATSGHTQQVREVRIDCDRDAVLYLVAQRGVACHTGGYSCFAASEQGLYSPLPHDPEPARPSQSLLGASETAISRDISSVVPENDRVVD